MPSHLINLTVAVMNARRTQQLVAAIRSLGVSKVSQIERGQYAQFETLLNQILN